MRKFMMRCFFLVWFLHGYIVGQCIVPNSEFKIRGFHLDFRTQVMTVQAIKDLADNLSKKGINTLIIEYEATFPFLKHATLCNEYVFTRPEIEEIVNYCKKKGIDIIPLQNCFGHCEYILKHKRYAHLREDSKEVSQICPLKIAEAKNIFQEIFREVAELHPSPYFHIGADETYLLGSCKRCKEVDKSRLFVDYVNAMCQLVKEMGKQPIIWADIVLKYPEAIHDLPKDLIYVDWNYGWEPDYFGKLDNLLALGARIWGASSMRSHPDNIYLTQWMKHFSNLAVLIPFAQKYSYEGIIQTSWSTSGTYGFHYDTGWEIMEMQPIRQVYPMNGFQILIDAFCQAIDQEEPLDVEKFICDYAKQRYGFSEKDSKVFLRYFQLQQVVVDSKSILEGKKLNDWIEKHKLLQEKWQTLSAQRNAEEFAHYGLMLDLRINYLKYKVIENIFESTNYTPNQASDLLMRLENVIQHSQALRQQFNLLQRSYLKSGQTEKINVMWTEKMNKLRNILQRHSRM